MRQEEPEKLRILHCFRSPVGGIFRHVRDLIAEQVKAGHEVGLICDDNTGGAFEERNLAELSPRLSLGLHRVSIDRSITPRDLLILYNLYNIIKGLKPHVIHSHGAKGGAYGRLIGSVVKQDGKRPARLYCPHGGSIHYDTSKRGGWLFFWLERLLMRLTDRLIFVSRYERDEYLRKVGTPPCPYSLVVNGLTESEFTPIATKPNASDFIYIGMMRDLKGVDLFINALPIVAEQSGRIISATLVGDGPDLERYKQQVSKLGDTIRVQFLEPRPAAQAFGLGRVLVVPSRAESMPYIVLEALAAQRRVLATRIGGIPEIFGTYSNALVEPDNLDALAYAMSDSLNDSSNKNGRFARTDKLAEHLRGQFSASTMAVNIEEAYRATLQDR